MTTKTKKVATAQVKIERRVSEKKTYEIPIRRINSNTNPRNPLSPALAKLGWDGLQGDKPIWELATSDDPEERAEYVKLIQEHDPELASVVATLLSVGLEQPIEVREGGSGTYTLVYGARRCLAALFNWCVLGKPKEPFIEARLVKGNEATLLHRAVIENIRKHQSVIDEAKVIQLSLNAGDTKEEVAEQLGMSLSTIENRLKLLELDPKTQHKIHDGSMSVKKAKAESNGHVEPSKPPIRKRREIEEAAEEFALDRPERKILEWVLGRSDDKS